MHSDSTAPLPVLATFSKLIPLCIELINHDPEVTIVQCHDGPAPHRCEDGTQVWAIGGDGVVQLASALEGNPHVTELWIPRARLGARGAELIAGAIQSLPSTNLTKLGLSWNAIGDAGAACIARAITSSHLHTLGLGGNCIGAAGAASLARGIESCRFLSTLGIGNNRIGEVGAASIASALRSCPRLAVLDITYNEIRDKGACSMAQALVRCPRLHTLVALNNEIGDAGAAQLRGTIAACWHLRCLALQGNTMGKGSLASLSSAMGSLAMQRPRSMAAVLCLGRLEVAPCGHRRLESELVKWIVTATWEILWESE